MSYHPTSTQAFETALNPLGELLDAITGSQRRQTQLGIKVPSEMAELAKSYRDRWDQLKAMVSSRHSRIQESITEFDTSNIMDTSKLFISYDYSYIHHIARYFQRFILTKQTLFFKLNLY